MRTAKVRRTYANAQSRQSFRRSNTQNWNKHMNIYEPRHEKMCLRDKFGHLEILWFLNRSLYDEQTHFCLNKLLKLLEKILEFELWTA